MLNSSQMEKKALLVDMASGETAQVDTAPPEMDKLILKASSVNLQNTAATFGPLWNGNAVLKAPNKVPVKELPLLRNTLLKRQKKPLMILQGAI